MMPRVLTTWTLRASRTGSSRTVSETPRSFAYSLRNDGWFVLLKTSQHFETFMDSDSPRDSNSSDSGTRIMSILSRREPSSSLYLLPPPSPNLSTATSTPFASRSTSPLPAFYPIQSSSSPSDSDSETSSYPLSPQQSFRAWKQNKKPWWAVATGRRRRDHSWRIHRWFRRWQRRFLFHALFSNQPPSVASVFFSWLSTLHVYS